MATCSLENGTLTDSGRKIKYTISWSDTGSDTGFNYQKGTFSITNNTTSTVVESGNFGNLTSKSGTKTGTFNGAYGSTYTITLTYYWYKSNGTRGNKKRTASANISAIYPTSSTSESCTLSFTATSATTGTLTLTPEYKRVAYARTYTITWSGKSTSITIAANGTSGTASITGLIYNSSYTFSASYTNPSGGSGSGSTSIESRADTLTASVDHYFGSTAEMTAGFVPKVTVSASRSYSRNIYFTYGGTTLDSISLSAGSSSYTISNNSPFIQNYSGWTKGSNYTITVTIKDQNDTTTGTTYLSVTAHYWGDEITVSANTGESTDPTVNFIVHLVPNSYGGPNGAYTKRKVTFHIKRKKYGDTTWTNLSDQTVEIDKNDSTAIYTRTQAMYGAYYEFSWEWNWVGSTSTYAPNGFMSQTQVPFHTGGKTTLKNFFKYIDITDGKKYCQFDLTIESLHWYKQTLNIYLSASKNGTTTLVKTIDVAALSNSSEAGEHTDSITFPVPDKYSTGTYYVTCIFTNPDGTIHASASESVTFVRLTCIVVGDSNNPGELTATVRVKNYSSFSNLSMKLYLTSKYSGADPQTIIIDGIPITSEFTYYTFNNLVIGDSYTLQATVTTDDEEVSDTFSGIPIQTFDWDNPKVSGEEFNLTASEWNAFIKHLQNKVLGINWNCSTTTYPYTTAVKGNNFTYTHFNQAVKMIKAIGFYATVPSISYVNKYDVIKASYFSSLLSALNANITSRNSSGNAG